VAGIESFGALIVDAALERAAAVKANLAFFEAFGSRGIGALERLRARIPDRIPFIADAKRGDIGSTAQRQAAALFDALGADAVTANPYLGRDALAPFLDREDRFTYVLCRTSNPSAAEIQNLAVEGEPIYLRVARQARHWAGARANVGLVVGATAPSELSGIRAAVPDLPLLVPGIGAQGGDLEAVLTSGPVIAGPLAARRGGALLVNVSRGIASAADESSDHGAALHEAVGVWAARLQC
jgi:orotidine-5'-phosphate decarboxylase